MKQESIGHTLGTRLRELRTARGLSQRALGERIGVSNRAVSKWEADLATPAVPHLCALARVLGVPMEALLTGDVPQEPPHPAKQTRMESLRELYRIGRGPSSSHTMGPERAARLFRERYPTADAFEATLYGSLAKTGAGHGTDTVLMTTLAPAPLPCPL